MSVKRTEELAVAASEDVVRVRQTVRAWMVEAGFRLVYQTKMVTAASELAGDDRDAAGRVLTEAQPGADARGAPLRFADAAPLVDREAEGLVHRQRVTVTMVPLPGLDSMANSLTSRLDPPKPMPRPRPLL